MERTKHTFRLRAGDVPFLQEQFPDKGANYAIEKLVANFVDQLRKPSTNNEELMELIEDGAEENPS